MQHALEEELASTNPRWNGTVVFAAGLQLGLAQC